MPPVKKRIPKPDLSKYDSTPLYLYTEKDSLNRVTVLKETAKDIYLIAGRYFGVEGDARLYTPLTDERSEEHTSELQSQSNLVCRLLLEKKKKTNNDRHDVIYTT